MEIKKKIKLIFDNGILIDAFYFNSFIFFWEEEKQTKQSEKSNINKLLSYEKEKNIFDSRATDYREMEYCLYGI